jgi:hypothetical protein
MENSILSFASSEMKYLYFLFPFLFRWKVGILVRAMTINSACSHFF